MKRSNLESANKIVFELELHEKIRGAGPEPEGRVRFDMGPSHPSETFCDEVCAAEVFEAVVRYLDRRREVLLAEARKLGLDLER